MEKKKKSFNPIKPQTKEEFADQNDQVERLAPDDYELNLERTPFSNNKMEENGDY